MADLYGIVAVCTKPGKDGLYQVPMRVGVTEGSTRLWAEEVCVRLNSEPRPAQVLRYEAVEFEEWDRLAIQQRLTNDNAWL